MIIIDLRFWHAFPLVKIILPVLERLRRRGISLILMSRRWWGMTWYAEMISPLAVPCQERPPLLRQRGGYFTHGYNCEGCMPACSSYNLMAKGLRSMVAAKQNAGETSNRGIYTY